MMRIVTGFAVLSILALPINAENLGQSPLSPIARSAAVQTDSTRHFLPTPTTASTGTLVYIALLPPCRAIDTRTTNPPALAMNVGRTFNMPGTGCAPIAPAYALNVIATQYSGNGNIAVYPTGTTPSTSSVNFGAQGGPNVANMALVAADSAGSVDALLSIAASSSVVIDVYGYFVNEPAASTSNTPNTLVLRDSAGDFSAGTITANKVRGAVYKDLAEWVPSPKDVPPGTVMVLDPADGERVIPSTSAYDMRVAGIVSENPSILLGEGGSDKSQVATTGRVYVFADADTAPIRVGDLLVTSDAVGMAMRSQPDIINGHRFHRPGTIIGKALQALPAGQGKILVLLSLQ